MENRLRARGVFLAAALAFLLSSLPSFAQDEPVIPFPFVSRLTTEVSASQVKLSWKDPPGFPGQLVVFRSTEELTAQNIGQATVIGRVQTGVQYFIDTPPDDKGYFYAVLLKDPDGTIHSVLIPFRNKTLAAVSARAPASEEQAAARITNIKAVPAAGGDGVEVTFTASNPERDLLIFRSTSPIAVPEDLLSSTSATQLDPGTTRFVVPALPGVDYWIAVMDAGMYKLGQAPLVRGENTTPDPLQVPLASGRISLAPPAAPRRPQPLPSLEITYGVRSGRPLGASGAPDIAPERKVSAATEKAIAALLAEAPGPPPLSPQRAVLPADATPSLDRDAGVLQGIVNGPFLGGDLDRSEKALLGFLSLHHEAQLQARAHFYLGQAYFLDKRPRDALLEFIQSEDGYYHDAQAWEDACFQELEHSGRPPRDPAFSP